MCAFICFLFVFLLVGWKWWFYYIFLVLGDPCCIGFLFVFEREFKESCVEEDLEGLEGGKEYD